MPDEQISPQPPPRPIEYCYWVVPGLLLAGEYPRDAGDDEASRAKLSALTDAGIVSFIDLTEERMLHPYSHWLDAASVTHRRFPIRDISVPNSPQAAAEILDAIDDDIANGRPAYIHCLGGIGRTGLIVGCWLSRHGHEGTAALEKLRELWAHNPKSRWADSPETRAQERYILKWREDAK